jgi:hypothetical protein
LTDQGQHFGEVVFGPDIYPGGNVADANSALSVESAAAHELAHFHRWKDKLAIADDEFEHLDEALTSLAIVQRYDRALDHTAVRQLVADAIQRIQHYVSSTTLARPWKLLGSKGGRNEIYRDRSPLF